MSRLFIEIRFRIGSVHVAVEPWFWLTAMMVGLHARSTAIALGLMAAVFVSVLVHELGHAFCAIALGTRASVRLYAFGGITFCEKRLSRNRDLLMALAGPVTGLCFGGLALLPGHFHFSVFSPLTIEIFNCVGRVSVFWGVLNLLPVLPLDGGHVLLDILGPTRQRLMLLVGGIVGVTVAVVAGWLGLVFPAVLLSLLAFRNLQAWWMAGKAGVAGMPGVVLVDEALAKGWACLAQGDDHEAERVARLILANAGDPESRNGSRDLLAWISLARANHRDALLQMERCEPRDSGRALTWALVLEAVDDLQAAVGHALRALETEPSETSASLAVRLLVKLGRYEEAQKVVDNFSWPRPAGQHLALGEVNFNRGLYVEAAQNYAAAFESSRQPGDAYHAAHAFARSGDHAQAAIWLRWAIDAGFDDFEQLRANPDLSTTWHSLENVAAAKS